LDPPIRIPVPISVRISPGPGFVSQLASGFYRISLRIRRIADVNGDSQPDLLVASICGSNCSGAGVAVLLSKADPTTTTVTTSDSPSQLNQPVTFTATITSTRGPIANGQTVTFFDGTTKIGTGTTAQGVATFTTSLLKAGTHTIKGQVPRLSVLQTQFGHGQTGGESVTADARLHCTLMS